MRRLVPVLFVLLSGCVSTSDPNAAFSTVRVEPMGRNQYMISCVDSAAYCARQANRSCPGGNYDVVSNTNNPRDFGRTTMIIRCQ
jgi:hypothetical protein